MQQTNIRLERQITLDASGNGIAVIDNMIGPNWIIKQLAVKTTALAAIPVATTYIGRDASGVYISNTLTGDNDTDSLPNVTIKYGESICAVWQGGDANAVARFTVIYDESG